MCCSVLQCVVVAQMQMMIRFSKIKDETVHYQHQVEFEGPAVVCFGVFWCVVVCCGVLWCVVVCCGVFWCVVGCFGVLQSYMEPGAAIYRVVSNMVWCTNKGQT